MDTEGTQGNKKNRCLMSTREMSFPESSFISQGVLELGVAR